MILRAMVAPARIARCLVRTAFTAGAVAGTVGMLGLFALRRALNERSGQVDRT